MTTKKTSQRLSFPRRFGLSSGAELSRFTLKKLGAYKSISITPEQAKMVTNEPIKTLFRVLFAFGCGKLYLIEENGKICGYIALWVNPRIGKYVIAPLIIDKYAQGRGLGRAALEAACKMLFAAGAPSVAFAVHPENAAAISLYKKLGFAFTGKKWGKTDMVMRLERNESGFYK